MIDPVLFPPAVVAGAQEAQRRFGAPACVILAQYAEESGFGKKVTGDFNYFGEKWEPGCRYPFKECPTEEEVDGKDVPEIAKFVSFPSPTEAFDFQGWCLTNPHGPYAKATKFLPNWRCWLHLIARTYSSDQRYEEKITQLVLDYQLEHWNHV